MRSPAIFVTLAVIMVVGIGTLSAIRFGPIPVGSNKMTSTVAAKTCTGIPAISYLYCPTHLLISAEGTPGASPYGNNTVNQGSWNFTVSISSNCVEPGQTVLLDANLTNISGASVTIKNFVGPYINPTVSDANGTQLWAWNPPEITWNNQTFLEGENLHQDVSIPTSQLKQGIYIIAVAPISIQFPTPNGYTFTFHLTVGCGSQ